MFEQDLPGENKGGLNFQKPSQLPLESCVTMNNSWGFNITDTSYKTPKQLINLLVKASWLRSQSFVEYRPNAQRRNTT